MVSRRPRAARVFARDVRRRAFLVRHERVFDTREMSSRRRTSRRCATRSTRAWIRPSRRSARARFARGPARAEGPLSGDGVTGRRDVAGFLGWPKGEEGKFREVLSHPRLAPYLHELLGPGYRLITRAR